MKKSILLLTLTLFILPSAHAELDLPILDCEIIQAAGNFNSFVSPEIGQKISLNLNKPQDIIQNGQILFFDGGYISMNNMPSFRAEKILNSSHDHGGIHLQTGLVDRKVKIEILGPMNANKLDAWLINEESHSTGKTLGMISLTCYRR